MGGLSGNLPLNFDWEAYLKLNPDLGKAGIHTRVRANIHWKNHGHKENRKYSKEHFSDFSGGTYKINEHKNMTNDYQIVRHDKKIAVLVHCYFIDILMDEIIPRLLPLRNDAFFYFNFVKGRETPEALTTIKRSFKNFQITFTDNPGRDIRGFLYILNSIYSQKKTYDYYLFLHTKKSLHGIESGTIWRNRLLNGTVANTKKIEQILSKFEDDPTIGMISSKIQHLKGHGSEEEKIKLEKCFEKFGMIKRINEFIGGTMFWVRAPILDQYFNKSGLLEEIVQDFTEDGIPHSGWHHAFERLFGSMVMELEYQISHCDEIITTPNKKREKVIWILPSFNIGGGNRGIFEVGENLLKFGYDVEMYSMSASTSMDWYGRPKFASFVVINENDIINRFNGMNIDHIIATGWQTCELVNKIPAKKKYYFIQDYEPWFNNADVEKAKMSYHYNFERFVVSNWLKEKLLADHGASSTFVPMGTRLLNTEKPKKWKSTLTLVALVKHFAHTGRNCQVIAETLHSLSKNNIRIITYGQMGKADLRFFDPQTYKIDHRGAVNTDQLAKIYEEADLLLDMSKYRGTVTACMEASQFGVVPFITNPNIGVTDHGYINDINFIEIAPDPSDAIEKIVKLTKNPEKFEQMSQEVIDHGYRLNWFWTADAMDKVMQRKA